MNSYITAHTIKTLREQRGMTQSRLAELIGVTAKAVSKWETAKGLPDITLIEPLANALGVSVIELMSGDAIFNRNKSANILRGNFYVCPVCGNIIQTVGEAVISCCGITLPPLDPEPIDEAHGFTVQSIEDEIFISIDHEMSRSHYISFAAYHTSDRMQLLKLYPEGGAEFRFPRCGHGYLYIYCNRHGLMRVRV